MGIALDGVPEHQMPMPDGIVSARIDSATGCHARRAGRRNAIFEMFREGHVPPDCDSAEAAPDIFNDASGVDPLPAEDETDADESLF